MKDSSFETIRNRKKRVRQSIFRKSRRVFKKETKSRYLDNEIYVRTYLRLRQRLNTFVTLVRNSIPCTLLADFFVCFTRFICFTDRIECC